jgi:glycosyltransferase involved in cell wall biosynthesis
MNEIILIKTKKESDWVSCQSIVSNLESAYSSSADTKIISIIQIEDGCDEFELFKCAQEILNKRPAEIVFIDHRPHPAGIISRFEKLDPGYRPVLTFHIFGDFVLESSHWYEINSILKNYRVNFVCASAKQKELIDTFLNQDQCTSIAPFPVQKNVFYYDKQERDKVRDSLGLKPSDFLFLYTGRISLQKNVLELIRAIASCLPLAGDNLFFFFAGPFDDLGIPYKGQENPPGAYFQRWVSINQSIDQTKIKYIDNLEPHELRQMYNCADCYISLSTHNDEDFGMSPAEALMCGLQVMLTDWGGFSSFKTFSKNFCELLPIEHHMTRILPKTLQVQKHIYKKMNNKMSDEERRHLSAEAIKEFSIESATAKFSKRIQVTKPAQFPGFNSHFFKLSSIFKSNPKEPFKGSMCDYSDFYFETYRPYMKGSQNE